MRKKAGSILLALIVLIFLTGCASVDVKVTKVLLRENRQDAPLSGNEQKQALLDKLFHLLKQNKNKELKLFETDPASKAIKNEGIRWYVQGGPVPAPAKMSTVTFTDVLYIDRENLEIKCKIKSDITWLFIPVMNAESEAILSIESENSIKLTYNFLYSWMIIGTGVFKYEWVIDYIDFDTGTIGAYYAVGGGGPTSGGAGSGYMLVRFGKEADTSMIASTPASPDSQQEDEPAAPSRQEVTEPPPELVARVTLHDASGNGILDGGEEIDLSVSIKNGGQGMAKDVRVDLSGTDTLVYYLGKKKFAGDIGPGETKMLRFTTVMPTDIPADTASILVDITEGRGFSPSQRKTFKVAMRPTGMKETVEVISERPFLVYRAQIKDQNNNRVLDGGEEVQLIIEVVNTGDSPAKDVSVMLSGSRSLVSSLGEERFVGDIRKDETKLLTVKAKLPANVPPETAILSVEIREGNGFSPLERKTFKVAMRPIEIKETVEVISEVSVDDIPPKPKNYNANDNYALVIGIGKYREKIIPEIRYAERDAEIVAKYLEHVGGIPKQNIKLLKGENATRSDLVAYSGEWLSRRINKNSTVVIYYAGHGAPDPQGSEAYIVPYEGHPDFPSKLYPLKKLYDTLGTLPAREVIVMLDSCFSGARGRSVTSEGARPISVCIENPILASENITVIAGATGSQISSDFDKVEHGLFTYYLLRGMRGEADKNMNGTVELGELYDYVEMNVSERASLELNRDQTPVMLPPKDQAEGKLATVIARYR